MLFGRLVVLFFILLRVVSYGQTIIVFDSETGESIPGCVVTCSGTDSTWHFRFLTDTSGIINLSAFEECTKGDIVVDIRMTSFLPFIDTISSKGLVRVELIPSHEALEELVVTGSYTPQTTDNSIHKIRVINRERIENQGAVSLRDVLANENNIRLSQDGVLGSSMTIMGVSGENVKIMIDGVPVIGRLDGSIDLSQISLDNIERIEIVEGPLSTVYGTNALGGTINLITKKESKEKWSVKPGLYYETSGQYNTNISASVKKSKDHFLIHANRNYFNGWSQQDNYRFFPTKTIADSSRFKTWKPKTQYTTSLTYQRKIKSVLLQPSIRYFTETVLNRGLPRQPYNESAFDDRYRTTRYDAGMNLSGKLKSNHIIQIVGSFNTFERVKNTWYKDLTNLNEILANPSEQDTSSFQLWMSRGFIASKLDSSWINYQIGYDVSYEIAEGARIIDQKQTIGDYALFGSINASVLENKLDIQPGIRVAYNTDYRSPVVPSVNLKYKTEEWTIRGSYANGFRSPSLKELYFRFVDINHDIHGNSDLAAERSHNVQISAQKKVLRKKFVLRTGVSLFYNHIYNKIGLAIAGNGLYEYINIDEFLSNGVKLDLRIVTNSLSGNFGLAYIGRQNQAGSEYGNSNMNFSPEISTNISYRIDAIKSNVSLFYKYTGKLETVNINSDGGIFKGQVDDYHTMDLSLSRHFMNKKIHLVTGVKNLFNVVNINSTASSGGVHSSAGSNLVAWGRTYFVTIQFNFSGK